ncbi:unnamed protein product [Linum tenue]|uniref:Uncharacterized protein n=1 Tax=Linum tenue TaxID=586396 RepID=A0AAV0P063_9ROSI|nr:unnamed protein product [Linum tenue]
MDIVLHGAHIEIPVLQVKTTESGPTNFGPSDHFTCIRVG